MRYIVWDDREPDLVKRYTTDALTDYPPRCCSEKLDEVSECASCGEPIRMREGYASRHLHVRCDARSGYRDMGEDYPALICADCAREEGQVVDEQRRWIVETQTRIESIERNIGQLVGALRELTEIAREAIIARGAYRVGDDDTVAK